MYLTPLLQTHVDLTNISGLPAWPPLDIFMNLSEYGLTKAKLLKAMEGHL